MQVSLNDPESIKAAVSTKRPKELHDSVPTLLTFATQTFLGNLVKESSQNGFEPPSLDDIIRTIETNPKYAFLKPLAPQLTPNIFDRY